MELLFNCKPLAEKNTFSIKLKYDDCVISTFNEIQNDMKYFCCILLDNFLKLFMQKWSISKFENPC